MYDRRAVYLYLFVLYNTFKSINQNEFIWHHKYWLRASNIVFFTVVLIIEIFLTIKFVNRIMHISCTICCRIYILHHELVYLQKLLRHEDDKIK